MKDEGKDKDNEFHDSPGTIALCPHMGCAFKCCEFQQTGAIFLYPGELEQAAAGKSVTHLEILNSNFHGGKLARCRASDRGSCDQGYKPLDCASYPFFPAAPLADASVQPAPVVKDDICPLQTSQISSHRRYVAEIWKALVKKNPAVGLWLKSIWEDDTECCKFD